MPLAEINGIRMYYESHGRGEALMVIGKQDTTISSSGNHVEAAPVLAERISDACLVVIAGVAHRYLWQMTEYGTELVMQDLQAVSSLPPSMVVRGKGGNHGREMRRRAAHSLSSVAKHKLSGGASRRT